MYSGLFGVGTFSGTVLTFFILSLWTFLTTKNKNGTKNIKLVRQYYILLNFLYLCKSIKIVRLYLLGDSGRTDNFRYFLGNFVDSKL